MKQTSTLYYASGSVTVQTVLSCAGEPHCTVGLFTCDYNSSASPQLSCDSSISKKLCNETGFITKITHHTHGILSLVIK